MTHGTSDDHADAVESDQAPLERDLLQGLREGTIIEGKYRVDRVIGRGGMGVVVAATHLDLDERVALKFLQVRDGDTSGDFHARFSLEARVCAKLKNEHIARVYDVGLWREQVPFMVMEYLEGIDLRRVLRAESKVPLERAADYMVQICQGLAEAHAQGIVHRDLKPPNIFITQRPDGSDLIKVLDFGISKWASREDEVDDLTKAGVMLGSPKYMSPEQLNGSDVDARADVWSLGAIFYGMLTGRPAYDFPSVTQTFMAIATGTLPEKPSTFEPAIPAALDALVLRCLARDREQRVQNVAELAGALLEALESPFAAQIGAQIGAVLDPAASRGRNSILSLTTGSHAAFSMGGTGASTMSPAIASHAPPGPAHAPRRSTKRWWAAGGAIALIALLAVARSPGIAAGGQASNAPLRSKSAAAKQLTLDAAQSLAPVLDPVMGAPRARAERPWAPAPRVYRRNASVPGPAAAPASSGASTGASTIVAPPAHAAPSATDTPGALDERQ